MPSPHWSFFRVVNIENLPCLQPARATLLFDLRVDRFRWNEPTTSPTPRFEFEPYRFRHQDERRVFGQPCHATFAHTIGFQSKAIETHHLLRTRNECGD